MNTLGKIPYLTITGCLISIIVSVGIWKTPDCDAPCFYRFGGGDIEFIYAGGYWKIFTASFLHSDMLHLIGNLIFLLFFGSHEGQCRGLHGLELHLAGRIGSGNSCIL
jgi:membrane associated rhomboid family serine protease